MITNFIRSMGWKAHYAFLNYLAAVYTFAKSDDVVTSEMLFFHDKVLSINAPKVGDIWVNVETSETIKVMKVLPCLSKLHDGIANVSDAKGRITFVKNDVAQVLTFEAFAEGYIHQDALYDNAFRGFKAWNHIHMDSLPAGCKQSVLRFLNRDNFAAMVKPALDAAVAARGTSEKAGSVLGTEYQETVDTFAPNWEYVLFNGHLDVHDNYVAELFSALNVAFAYELAVKLMKEKQK